MTGFHTPSVTLRLLNQNLESKQIQRQPGTAKTLVGHRGRGRVRLRTKVSLLPSFSKLESPAGDRPPRAGMRRGSTLVFDAVRRRAAVSLRHRFLSAAVLAFCVLTALPDGAGAQTVPVKPAGFRTEDGNTQVRLRWTGPDDPTITEWQYAYKLKDEALYSDWTGMEGSGPDTRRHTVTGLANNRFYKFKIRAVNAVGLGRESNEKTGETYNKPPDKPAGFQAIPGDRKALLIWNDADDVSIRGWEYRQDKSGRWRAIPGSGANTTGYTVTGLENGTGYTFELRAYNSAGNGYVSDATTVTPMPAAPGKPTGFSVEPGNRQAVLTWDDPGNDTITKWQYAYRSMSGDTGWTDIAGSGPLTVRHVVSMLENDTLYAFRIRAVNRIGAGAESGEISATPATRAPEKPAGLKALAGDREVVLYWTVPSDASISKWQYRYKTTSGYGSWTDIPGSGAATTSYTVPELVNGATYAFQVRAVNEVGDGPESGEAFATPLSIPAKPSGFKVAAGDARVVLGWDNPSNTTISGWEYSFKTSGDYGAWMDIAGSDADTTGYTVADLANDVEHVFRIRALNASGYGAESDGLAVTPRPAPAKPSGLRAVAGNTQVRLVWTDPNDNSIDRWQYSVKTAGSHGSWTDISGSGAATVRHTVTDLGNNTVHFFRIRAVNGSGAGPESDEASATPRAAAPARPTGFRARAGDGEVVLKWNDPDDSSIEGWQYKSKEENGDYKDEWNNIPGSGAKTVQHTVTGLENGKTYVFKIRAVNETNGYESGERPATPRSLRPGAPTGLIAAAGDRRVALIWNDPEDATITGWQYSVKTTGDFGEWVDIPDSAAATTAYTVTGIDNGARYGFKLRAVNERGGGAESGQVFATPTAAPARPTGFEAAPGDRQVRLDWNDPDDPTVTGWQYSYRTTGRYGPWIDIPGSHAGTTGHTVTGLDNGTPHIFRIRAVNNSGNGVESIEAVATPVPVPAKPTGLTAAPGDGQVVLTWDDPSDPTIASWEYNLRQAGGAFEEHWTHILGSTAATTSYTVIDLENGISHALKLRAVNASGQGAESDEAAATPLPVPARPTGVTATPGDGQVRLNWDDPNDPTVTGWQYSYRTTGSPGPWIDIPGSHAGTTGHTVTGLDNDTPHIFRIRALNTSGSGVASGEAAAAPVPVPAKPRGLTAAPGDGQVVLTWDDPSDMTITGWEYNLRQAGGAFEEHWTHILGSSAATTRYSVIGLETGVSYAFKVRAVSNSGVGAESEEANVILPPVPAKPPGVTATPGDGQVFLEWAALDDLTVTGWQYSYRTTGGYGRWFDIPDSNAAATSHRVTGLDNRIPHTFRVRAVNSSGHGVESDETTVVPFAVPAKPTGFTATPGSGQVLLEWNDLDDPTITAWQYNQRRLDGEYEEEWTNILGSTAATTKYTVTGLDAGVSYGFKVRALSMSGIGAESDEAVSALPPVPAQPEGLAAAAGDREAVLTWKLLGDPTVTLWQYSYRTTGGHGNWIDIPGSGANTAGYTVTGLAVGVSHTFRIRAVNSSGEGAESGEAAATPFAVPAKPTGFTATSGGGQVLLEWDDPDDPTITGWEYNRRKEGETFEEDWTPILGSGAATTSYLVVGLEVGASYGFKIRAAAGDRAGAESEEETVALPPVPAKPVGLTAMADNGRIVLTWDSPNDATITLWQYRYRAAGGGYGQWIAIPGSGAATTSLEADGLDSGIRYSFRIRAVNESGNGVESDEVAAIPFAVPAKPTGFTATPGSGQVLLEWDNPNDPAITGWEYNQRLAGEVFEEDWTPILGSGAATTSYLVVGLEVGASYGLKVRAVNANSTGVESDEVVATLPLVPARPEELMAAAGDREAVLTWKPLGDPTVTLWQYRYRTEGRGYRPWTRIANSNAGTADHTVTGLAAGVEHNFRIRAVNDRGNGLESEEVAVTPFALPARPTGFTATAGDGVVLLEWDDPRDDTISGYQYTQRQGDGEFEEDWTVIPAPAARSGRMRYTVIGLENGVAYAFKLRAINASGESEEAVVSTATPAGVPDAPTNFTATPGDGRVALRWRDPEDPSVTVWRYRYKTTGDFEDWRDIRQADATTPAGFVGYTVTGLDNDVAHYFQVRAVSASGAGPPSETAKATPEPSAPDRPTGLEAFPGYERVMLTWNDPKNPAIVRWQYVARAKDDSDKTPDKWLDIAGSGANTTRHVVVNGSKDGVVTALEGNVAYIFRVRACVKAYPDHPLCGLGSDPVFATPKAAAKPAERRAVKAALAGFARQVAAGAEAAIGARFSADPAVSRVILAGRQVPLFAPVRKEWTRPGPPAGKRQATVRGMSGRELLQNSSFQAVLGPPGGEERFVQWTLWHRSDLRRFEGSAGQQSRYGGRMLSAWFGADMRLGRHWLFGAALACSEGEVDYAAGVESGVLKAALDSVHPYLQRRFEDGGTAWITLGGGLGTIENETTNRDIEIVDTELATVSAGFRKPLPALLGLTLSASGAVGLARLETDGDARTATGSLSASTGRQSLGIGAAFEEGPALRYASLSLRRDGGDGLAGAGLEFASGFRSPLPAFSGYADVRLQGLVWHSDREYREFGLTATVRKPVDASRRGPSWSLAAAHRTPDRGSGEPGLLWSDGAPERGRRKSAFSLDLRAGWGLVSSGAAFTPYAALGLAGAKARRLTLGLDMGPLPGPALKLAAERRIPRAGAPESRVTAALRFIF